MSLLTDDAETHAAPASSASSSALFSSASLRASLGVFFAALIVRMGVVLWAAGAPISPTADGAYYQRVAARIAEGQGYTWVWPDGAVTYAAHYPVGYPALVGLGYWIFGSQSAVIAMIINALLGSLAALAAHSLLREVSSFASGGPPSPRLALLGGLAVALHPVLVPYTPAVMTEGPTAALLVIAAAIASRARSESARRRAWFLVGATGIVMGVATLVRPQCLVLAPVLGLLALASKPLKSALLGALATTLLAVLVCSPWTARNCKRMEKCALVSVNGGWNLAIGTQTDNGGWHEIAVPDACKTVFQEAAKDECFGREAMKEIIARPGSWLARAPAKLRATFDYFGAAPWYLHTANARAFPYDAKVALGAIETLAARLLLAAALVALFRLEIPKTKAGASSWRNGVRRGACVVGLVACVVVPGTIGYLALVVATLALGFDHLRRAPLVVPFTALVIAATAATHAVFFGAGRYGIVVVPFVALMAFVRHPARAPLRD